MLIDVRPGLRTRLLANSDITAMVGTRIYPVRADQGIRDDMIVLVRVLENESYHYQGASGLILTRIQIDTWSADADRAAVLANLVKEQLQGFSGALINGASSPSDYVIVQGIFYATGFDAYDNEAELFRVSRDYNVIYEDQQ